MSLALGVIPEGEEVPQLLRGEGDCVCVVCPTVSSPLFMTCLWKIFSSIVPVVISLYTWQCCFCPSLHTLAMACRSVAGFQSMSYKTSLLAPIRFSPVPPALELSRNTRMSEVMLLNLSTMPCLVWGGVDPSSLQVEMLYFSQREPSRSRVEVLRDTSTIFSWVELASSNSRQVTVASLPACSSQVWGPPAKRLGTSSTRLGALHTFLRLEMADRWRPGWLTTLSSSFSTMLMYTLAW